WRRDDLRGVPGQSGPLLRQCAGRGFSPQAHLGKDPDGSAQEPLHGGRGSHRDLWRLRVEIPVQGSLPGLVLRGGGELRRSVPPLRGARTVRSLPEGVPALAAERGGDRGLPADERRVRLRGLIRSRLRAPAAEPPPGLLPPLQRPAGDQGVQDAEALPVFFVKEVALFEALPCASDFLAKLLKSLVTSG